MKRIEFIAPVEALRGNMSGSQTLVYAENDNPAFDAPEGRQYARNYKPRYIGFRRAKDGAVYFGVKRKSATKVDAASRITMAAMGTLQPLKNRLKEKTIQVAGISGKVWAWMQASYNVAVEAGEIPVDLPFEKWADQQLLDMLRYMTTTISFKPFPAPAQSTFSVTNPYAGFDDSNAELIAASIFLKFNPVLTANDDPMIFYINGKAYATSVDYNWADFKNESVNPNYVAILAPLTASSGETNVLWNAKQLYDSHGTAQLGNMPIAPGEKYTTIAPTA